MIDLFFRFIFASMDNAWKYAPWTIPFYLVGSAGLMAIPFVLAYGSRQTVITYLTWYGIYYLLCLGFFIGTWIGVWWMKLHEEGEE